MSRALERWRPGEPVAGPAAVLARGGVLAIPTESSYALAAHPASAAGVGAIFALKGRPADRPLPLVAAGREQIEALGLRWPHPELRRLAAAWPAPLSLVLDAGRPLPAAAGGTTVAVRVPAHRGLRQLLAELGHALTATSANPSGEPPALTPAAVAPLLRGADAMLFDDGPLPGGPPSTLVAWSGDRFSVLRSGRYPWRRLRGLSSAPISAAPVEMSADRPATESSPSSLLRNA